MGKAKEILHNLIRRKPGVTHFEIAQELGWPLRRVKLLTTRLEGDKVVVVKVYPTKLMDLEEALIYLNQSLENLRGLRERMQLRERKLFEEVVKAKQLGLEEKAKAYAIEVANIRALMKFMERNEKHVENLVGRVKTTLSGGSIIGD